MGHVPYIYILYIYKIYTPAPSLPVLEVSIGDLARKSRAGAVVLELDEMAQSPSSVVLDMDPNISQYISDSKSDIFGCVRF